MRKIYFDFVKNRLKCAAETKLFHLLAIAAFTLFLYGFFPMNTVKFDSKSDEVSSFHHLAKKQVIHKIVFMIIDGLRQDFVIPENEESSMPFLLSKIKGNEACHITTTVQAPTVTLPRLKCILSGTVSTFMDVITNVSPTKTTQENIVQLANSSGLKLLFYGDNAWLKLFPNSFTRSEGVRTSFPKDFFEPDSIITANVEEELPKNDWDVMFLHYLGVDLVGHAYGPKHKLIGKKLEEMDVVIKKISNSLKVKEEKYGIKTMLFVTGDHGMKDAGSHGGDSFTEVTVPFVSVGHACNHLKGWPDPSLQNAFQVDIAPTLSALTGLKLPRESIGKLMPEFLGEMTQDEILSHFEENKQHLIHFTWLKTGVLPKSLDKSPHNSQTTEEVTEQYYKDLDELSKNLIKLYSERNISYMMLSCLFLWFLVAVMFLTQFRVLPKPTSIIHYFLYTGSLLPIISYFSSSFVEEEHQTWYFLWLTLCILLCLDIINARQLPLTYKITKAAPIVALCVAHRVLRKLHQTGDKWSNLPDIQDYLVTSEGQTSLLSLFVLGLSGVFACAVKQLSPLERLTFGTSLLLVFFYRVAINDVRSALLEFYPTSSGYREVLLFLTGFTVFGIQSIVKCRPIYILWSLLAALFLKPCNVILVPMQIYSSQQLYQVLYREKPLWNSIAHIWLGYLFYFYQGNGNSFSYVDVDAGNIGLQDNLLVYTVFMIVAHTYSGHILAFLLSPRSQACYTFFKLASATVFCTVMLLHLNHLFIWSVFAPKMLFELTCTVIIFVLLIFNGVQD